MCKIPIWAVAVVQGRTRTLVERFERREKINSNEDQATGISNRAIPEVDKTRFERREKINSDEEQATGISNRAIPEVDKTRFERREKIISNEYQATGISNHAIPEVDKTPPIKVNICSLGQSSRL